MSIWTFDNRTDDSLSLVTSSGGTLPATIGPFAQVSWTSDSGTANYRGARGQVFLEWSHSLSILPNVFSANTSENYHADAICTYSSGENHCTLRRIGPAVEWTIENRTEDTLSLEDLLPFASGPSQVRIAPGGNYAWTAFASAMILRGAAGNIAVIASNARKSPQIDGSPDPGAEVAYALSSRSGKLTLEPRVRPAIVAPTIPSALAVPLPPGAEPLQDDPFPSIPDGQQPQKLSMSESGVSFLTSHEGIRRRMYNDSQGHCTIGIGHLVHRGNCNGTDPTEAPFRNGLSDEQVKDLLRQDLPVYESAVRNGITSRINQYQYDALVSFCYNIGTRGFANSGALRQVNARKYSHVPTELMKWVKPVEITGRRTDEANLFRTGRYR